MTTVQDGALLSVTAFKVTEAVYLDKAVEEVFGLMLGVPVSVVEEGMVQHAGTAGMTAMIGLAGVLSGTCAMVVEVDAAIHMVNCMVGMELDAVDETVLDGLGEISNMLAGAWKSKIPELDVACMLSVPTVVMGSHYVVHRKEPAFSTERTYRLGEHIFKISIYGAMH